MGEQAGRRIPGVVVGGPHCLLLGEVVRRRLPFDVSALDHAADGAARPYLRSLIIADLNEPGYREALIHRAEHVRRMLVQRGTKR